MTIQVGGTWRCEKCGESYHSSEFHTCAPDADKVIEFQEQHPKATANVDYQRGWRAGRDAAARVIQMVMSCPEDCGCSLNLSHAKILALTPPTEQPEPTTQPGLGARSGTIHQGKP